MASLRAWPNPVRSALLHVSLPQLSGRISLYDASGKLLRDKATAGGEEQIDFEALPAGQYLLKFQPAEGAALAIPLSR